jgi:flagellar motor switch protein FliM
MSNSGQVLTSDEVQALVDAMASGEVDVSPDTAASAAPAVQVYSLVSTDTTSRSQLAAIEMINDRFARQLRGGLLNLLRQSLDQPLRGDDFRLLYSERSVTLQCKHRALSAAARVWARHD